MFDKKILIAEDEHELAAALEELLREEGFKNIEHASDGVQMVRKTRELIPDLILLDMQMPGWHGFNALMKLKLSIPTSEIPFIVITGVQDAELKQNFIAEGARGYFQKPYKPELLLATIKKVLREKPNKPKAKDAHV